jgi:mono/diheme cytochrome c family protein
MPVGEIFNTISNGIRNMPAYGAQIPAEDRWAIVLYVRALERSRAASVADLTAQERAALQ